jgi:hypothetical protein
MKKIALIVLILFLIPQVSANINLLSIETYTDGDFNEWGLVRYKNVGNSTLFCTIQIFIDEVLLEEEIKEVEVKEFKGRLWSPIREYEFPLLLENGTHKITVYLYSNNMTQNMSCQYYIEDGCIQEE